MKSLSILGLGEACSLCLDHDGRKAPSKPVFVVGSDHLTWHVCGGHLAALVKASNGERPQAPAAQPAATKPPAAAVPVVSAAK